MDSLFKSVIKILFLKTIRHGVGREEGVKKENIYLSGLPDMCWDNKDFTPMEESDVVATTKCSVKESAVDGSGPEDD